MLDVSFNRLHQIKNLSALTNLRKLFLCANRISLIENLDHFSSLTMLELGDNKIRVSDAFTCSSMYCFLGNYNYYLIFK